MNGAIILKLSIVLEQNRKAYTKSEVKIYEYVKENLEKIMYYSLTELSEICLVGEATILRFCRKLGFTGYQDFKLAAAQELAYVSQTSSEKTYVEKIKDNLTNVINDTYAVLDEEILEKIVDLINEKKEIIIFGVGHSGITAYDMQSRLLRIGKNVEVITDPHFQIMRACLTSSETVIIAISLSGSTIDIVDSVSKGKENGANVVAITNYTKSPLTKISDFVLLTSARENPMDGGSMVAKVSQLFVIDLICTGLSVKTYEQSRLMKQKTAASISEKLY